MKNSVLVFYFFVWVFSIPSIVSAQETTTFVLVRHAEKVLDGSKDPELTEQGKQRAARLAEMLQPQPLAAIYATNYKRTQGTVLPVAEKKALKIQLYEPFKEEEVVRMIQQNKGKTVLIVGHSNNIPWIANLLIGDKKYADYEETNYSTVLIVTVIEKGKNATAIQITY